MESLKEQLFNLSLEEEYVKLLCLEREFVKQMPASNDIFHIYNQKKVIELTKEIQVKEAYLKVYKQRIEEYKAYQDKVTAEYKENFKNTLKEANNYVKNDVFRLGNLNLCQQITEHLLNYTENRLKDQEEKNNCYLALKRLVAQAASIKTKSITGFMGRNPGYKM